MKAKQVIEQLQRGPEDAEVYVQASEGGNPQKWSVRGVHQMNQAQGRTEIGRKGGEVYLEITATSEQLTQSQSASSGAPSSTIGDKPATPKA